MPSNPFRFMIPRLLAMLMLILTMPTVQALEVNAIYHSLSDSAEYLVDSRSELTLEDILSKNYQQQFQSGGQGKPQRPRQQSALWIKLTLNFKPEAIGKNFVISTMVNNYADIRIYRPQQDSSYSEYKTGNNYPADKRELDSARYSFKLIPHATQQIIYIRSIGAIDTYQLPWLVMTRELFETNSELFRIVNLVSIGAIFGVLVLSFGIGVTLANKNYLAYSSFLLFGLLSLSNQDGLAFVLFWPNNPGFNNYAVDIFNLGVSITRLLTIVTFLHLSQLSPRLFRASAIWIALLSLAFLLAMTTGLQFISDYLTGILWVLSTLFGAVICIYAIAKKTPLAIPLFLILSLPIFGNFYQAAASTGLVTISIFSLQAAKITFVIHALLFSICLAIEIQRKIDSRVIAQLDNLTGLPRIQLAKNAFQYAAAMADQYSWKIGVLFIDLDGFKPVNDRYGHQVGDQVLIEVAARLKQCLRDVDTVARIGGDEFLILQTEMKDAAAYTVVANNIQTALSNDFVINGQVITIGASIGIAIYPDHGTELNTLMKTADSAMYRIKNRGKNHFAIAPSTVREE